MITIADQREVWHAGCRRRIDAARPPPAPCAPRAGDLCAQSHNPPSEGLTFAAAWCYSGADWGGRLPGRAGHGADRVGARRMVAAAPDAHPM